MLLEFKTKNYKSFKDEVVFSMIPAPKQKGLDYSILKKTGGKKEYKALSSAVIYGPNASGKTNIIGAIQTFKSIVLRGNIKNAMSAGSLNVAENALELIPNSSLKEKEYVSFAIKFIQKEMLVNYSIKLDLGNFLEKTYQRKVIEEILEINEKTLFRRTEKDVSFENLTTFKDCLFSGFKKDFNTIFPFIQASLKEDDLFLMNGFKTMVSSKLAEVVYEYLKNYLVTVYRADTVYMAPVFDSKAITNEVLNEVAARFGINSNKLVYIKDDKAENPPVLCSVIPNKPPIPSEIYESYGTVRFVNLFPLITDALLTGATLLIDEFDSSIHPSAIMDIITIFHNDEVNIRHAQLIFNTHNPLYLNNNLFRRDEIKFIDRDDKTKCSRHYSLSDFGTKGTSARKGKDYMNNYFMDEYGAIRNIDFTDLFKKFVGEK